MTSGCPHARHVAATTGCGTASWDHDGIHRFSGLESLWRAVNNPNASQLFVHPYCFAYMYFVINSIHNAGSLPFFIPPFLDGGITNDAAYNGPTYANTQMKGVGGGLMNKLRVLWAGKIPAMQVLDQEACPLSLLY